MNISPQNFVTPDEILADALKLVNDSGFKINSKGYYISQIQQALEELSFDTFFLEENSSVDIPENLRIELPRNAFNLKQLYLFNGDECVIKNSTVVYNKKNFINSESGDGFVARDKYKNTDDPFHTQRSMNTSDRLRDRFSGTKTNLKYYGIQNGTIMLSSSCKGFDKLMMVYNSTGCVIGDSPVVPAYLRQAVKDYVVVKGLESRMASDDEKFNKWSTLYNIHSTNLNKPYTGSWDKAENRVKSLDMKERQDMKEYFSRLNY